MNRLLTNDWKQVQTYGLLKHDFTTIAKLYTMIFNILKHFIRYF